MPKSSNQKAKLLYLMKILLDNTDEEHGLTLSEISALLLNYGITAERKALYSDIEELRLFGIDIEMQKGKNSTYRVVSRDFEIPELKLLVDAVQSSKFITHKKSAELIKKIEGLASRHAAIELQRQVFVANRIKTMNESIYYSVDILNEAINKNRQISFQYFDWDENKKKVLRHSGERYVISPWALSWDDENYYLIGFDSKTNDKKHFRVDKMLSIKIEEMARDGQSAFDKFDVALYSKKTFSMFSGREENVTLLCKNSLAHIMIDRFGNDISFFKVDSEHFKFTVKVSISPLFLSWLVNFKDNVKILSPDSVISDFKELLNSSLNQY